jgi:hypothetical protein
LADSKAFEIVCKELEEATTLSSIEARGTVRIALKQSGLDASVVSAREMDVILRVVLPKELTLRGVDDADAVSEAVATTLQTANLAEDQRADSPEAVFSRLAG